MDKCEWCRKRGTDPLDQGDVSTLHRVTLTLNEYAAKRHGSPTATYLVCRDEDACNRRSGKAEDARERLLEESRND